VENSFGLQFNRYSRLAVHFFLGSPLWVFLAFFIFMLVQNRFVYLYHDDYGYLSLSYAANIQSVHGHVFTLRQLLQFLSEHYFHWGGGILVIAVLDLTSKSSLWVFRILQSVILTMTLVAIYSIVRRYYPRQISRWLIAFSLCCCYGLIGVQLHRDGTYWPTASVTYIWPLLALFAAVSIHLKAEEGKPNGWLAALVGVLYLIAGAAQLQIGLVAIVTASGISLAHALTKQNRCVRFVDGIAFFTVLAGFAFLALAPGNLARLNDPVYALFREMTLLDRLRLSIPVISRINLGQPNQALILLWTWSSAAVLWKMLQTARPTSWLYRLLFILCASFGILLTASLLPPLDKFSAWLYPPVLTIEPLIFWGAFLFAVSLAVVLFCLEKRLYPLLALFAGGGLSQVVMVFSPTWNYRSSLILLFTLFPVLAAMLAEVASEVRSQMIVKLALALLLAVAAGNSLLILRGYAANSPVLEANDRILSQAAQAIHHGATIGQITLQRLPDDQFAGEMPYTPDYEYINWWFKEYYDLPLDIDLVWK
jgi:hypothetical protein